MGVMVKMKTTSEEYMVGKRFGKLVVVNKADDKVSSNGKKRDAWLCICDCGNEIIVAGPSLRIGNTKTCGCSRHGENRKKHGQCYNRIYRVYYGMKNRCYNENVKSYKDYGAKGIKICDEWMNSFEAFYECAMDNGYDDSLTIDRIDNNGNYCPENCRWVTRKEQNNNTSQNRFIEYKGQRHTVAEWANITGITAETIRGRLNRGWTGEKALTEDVGVWRGGENPKRNRIVEIDGVRHSIAEWAKIKGMREDTLQRRLKIGWSVRDALERKVRRRTTRKKS